MNKREARDSGSVAIEIVSLRNRMAELRVGAHSAESNRDSDEDIEQLHRRLRMLQDQLAEQSNGHQEPEAPGNEVRYIPPA